MSFQRRGSVTEERDTYRGETFASVLPLLECPSEYKRIKKGPSQGGPLGPPATPAERAKRAELRSKPEPFKWFPKSFFVGLLECFAATRVS